MKEPHNLIISKSLLKRRRKNRHEMLTDSNDPLFVQWRKFKNGEINTDFADKYKIKDLASDIFDMPKIIFEFNSEGDIVKGSIPKVGNVILKYNRGADSRGIKIVHVSKITKDFLKKFAKDNKISDKNNKKWNTIFKDIDKKFYAEEYIEEYEEMTEFKVFTFKSRYLIEVVPRRRGDLFRRGICYLYDEDGKPIFHPTSMTIAPKKLDQETVELIASISNSIFKLSKRIGGFARIDLFANSKMVNLNEVTLTPGFPELWWYDKSVLNWSLNNAKKVGVNPIIKKMSDIDPESIKMILTLVDEVW